LVSVVLLHQLLNLLNLRRVQSPLLLVLLTPFFLNILILIINIHILFEDGLIFFDFLLLILLHSFQANIINTFINILFIFAANETFLQALRRVIFVMAATGHRLLELAAGSNLNPFLLLGQDVVLQDLNRLSVLQGVCWGAILPLVDGVDVHLGD
jgi:hypothetical protein